MKPHDFKLAMRPALAIGACFLVAMTAKAQPQYDDATVAKPALGTSPFGSYSISQIETVNTVTGNVSLRIPLTKLPPGRAGLTENLNLVYNSQIYNQNLYWADSSNVKPHTDPVEWHQLVPGIGGWRYEWDYNYGIELEDLPYYVSGVGNNMLCDSPLYGYIHSLVLYFPDGSRHPLHLLGYSDVDSASHSHNGY